LFWGGQRRTGKIVRNRAEEPRRGRRGWGRGSRGGVRSRGNRSTPGSGNETGQTEKGLGMRGITEKLHPQKPGCATPSKIKGGLQVPRKRITKNHRKSHSGKLNQPEPILLTGSPKWGPTGVR